MVSQLRLGPGQERGDYDRRIRNGTITVCLYRSIAQLRLYSAPSPATAAAS